MKKISGLSLALALVMTFAIGAVAQESFPVRQYPPLILTTGVPLPNVEGRFDHMSFDPSEPPRLFLAGLGNNSLEVINLTGGVRVHSIKPIGHPQGVVFATGLNKLFVGSRVDEKLYIYNGADYSLITTIDYKADVDNLRYDADAKRVYVDYGDGDKAAIGMVDAVTNQRLPEEYKTGVHAESFQMEKSGPNMYVNLPQLKQIAVINRKTHETTKWNMPFDENFPMALDEANHRLFVGTRVPPRLAVFDTGSGKMITAMASVADMDDLYYDSYLKRIYVIGGQGFVSVFQQRDADHYDLLANVPSALGGRTAGFPGQTGKKGGPSRLFVAIPNYTGQGARVLIYTPEE